MVMQKLKKKDILNIQNIIDIKKTLINKFF